MGWMGSRTEWVADHGIPVLLTAITGALSFSHIRDLALHGGQQAWQADALPVAVDAVTVYALRTMLSPKVPARTRAFAWAVFLAFSGISLAANLLDAPMHDVTGYFTAVLPSASFVCVTVIAHFSVHREPEETKSEDTSKQGAKAHKSTTTRSGAPRAAKGSLELAKAWRAANPGGTGKQFAAYAVAQRRAQGLPVPAERTLQNYFSKAAAAACA